MTELKKPTLNITSATKERCIRGVYIVIFFIIAYFVCVLIALTSIFQFVYNLIFRHTNANVISLGKNLGLYLYDIVQYITFNSDEAPFPFSAWGKK